MCDISCTSGRAKNAPPTASELLANDIFDLLKAKEPTLSEAKRALSLAESMLENCKITIVGGRAMTKAAQWRQRGVNVMRKRELVVASRMPETVTINVDDMAPCEQDALARTLMRSVTEAFKNPKVVAEYEQWKAARYKK